MFCEVCGALIENSDTECRVCGSKIQVNEDYCRAIIHLLK